MSRELDRDAQGERRAFTIESAAKGRSPASNQLLPQDDLAFFDRLASLTREPDKLFESLRALYEQDERVKVPGAVFNSLLNRTEAVAA